MTFFRYPGGKKKVAREITGELARLYVPGIEYREPFVGGGSIAVAFARNTPFAPIWINDWDEGIAALWAAILQYPEQLLEKVDTFTPSVEAFYAIKQMLLEREHGNFPTEPEDIVQLGFHKLAIHQISYSGLGTMSGGPLGGINQTSQYPINCRWSPANIRLQIGKIRADFTNRSVKVTNLDFADLLGGEDALIYLDPPYYEKGGELYQHSFTLDQHQRLATALRDCASPWVLSYDDAAPIREMYAWANIKTIEIGYSINALKDRETGERLSRTKTELLITNR